MIILGIETSCDETAAAVVRDDRKVLAERLLSQAEAHRPYGGIVPEIAARAHLEHIDRLVAEAMTEAGLRFDQLDGVAATGGPGLIGIASSWPSRVSGTIAGSAPRSTTRRARRSTSVLSSSASATPAEQHSKMPPVREIQSALHCRVRFWDGPAAIFPSPD